MKSKLDILKDVTVELDRFRKKLGEAFKEQSESTELENLGGQRKYAAVKRAAMDLKNELTKLTQDSKYRYQSP